MAVAIVTQHSESNLREMAEKILGKLSSMLSLRIFLIMKLVCTNLKLIMQIPNEYLENLELLSSIYTFLIANKFGYFYKIRIYK